MAEERERKPWERLPGEGSRQYAAFCIYRGLGPDRSLSKAVEQYLTVPGNKSGTRRARQQRRFQAHTDPANYAKHVRKNWARWSRYWQWVGRCQSYDDFAEERVRVEREAAEDRIRLAEIEENERQAKNRLTGFRIGREAANRLLQKVARGLTPVDEGGTGELLDMPAAALIPHLAKIAMVLDKCTLHERAEERRGSAPGAAELPHAGVPVEELTDEQLIERIRFVFGGQAGSTAAANRGGTSPTASEE